MSRQFLEAFRIDLTLFLRNRLALLWTFAFPLILLILLMAIFGGGTGLGRVVIAIEDRDDTIASRLYFSTIRELFENQHFLNATITHSEVNAQAEEDVAHLLIPRGFEEEIELNRIVQVLVETNFHNQFVSRAVEGLLRSATDRFRLKDANVREIAVLKFEDYSDRPQLPYAAYLVAGLVVINVLSTTLMGFAIPLVVSRQQRIYKLYDIFPVNKLLLLAAMIGSRLVVVVGSSIFLVVCAVIIYEMTIPIGALSIAYGFVLIIVGSVCFLALGIALASWSSSVTSASVLCNVVYFPMILIGDLFIPITNFPEFIRDIIQWMPVNILVKELRETLFVGDGIDWHVIPYLCALMLVSLGLSRYDHIWSDR